MSLLLSGQPAPGSATRVFDPLGSAATGNVRGFGELRGYYDTKTLLPLGSGAVAAWSPKNADGPSLGSSTSGVRPVLDVATLVDGYPSLSFSNANNSGLCSAQLADDIGDQPWALFVYCKVNTSQALANFLGLAAMARVDGLGGNQATGAIISLINAHDGGVVPFLQGSVLFGYDGRTVTGLSSNGGDGGVRDILEPVVSASVAGTLPYLNLPLLVLFTYDSSAGLKMWRNGRLVASMSPRQMALFGATRGTLVQTIIGFGAIARAAPGGDGSLLNCADFTLYAGGFWGGHGCDVSQPTVDAFHVWAAKTFPSLANQFPTYAMCGSSIEKAGLAAGAFTSAWYEQVISGTSGVISHNFSYSGGSIDTERDGTAGNFNGMYGVAQGTSSPFLGTSSAPDYNTAFENAFRQSGAKFFTAGGMPATLLFGGLATHDLDVAVPKTALQLKALVQRVIAQAYARGMLTILFSVVGRGDTSANTNIASGLRVWLAASETNRDGLRQDMLSNWNKPLGSAGSGGYGGGVQVRAFWDLWGILNSHGAPQDSASVVADALGSKTWINADGVHPRQAAHDLLANVVKPQFALLRSQRYMTQPLVT